MSDATPTPPPTGNQTAKAAATKTPTLASSGIALAGAALLIDAAVETLWSGSPVRSWVIGDAALYAGFVVATWRRPFDWKTRLSAIGLAVLGLTAITAWRPSGLTQGVRLVGQSTPVLLSILMAVGVLGGGAVLLRAKALPLAARTVAGLAVAYGFAAFAVGAFRATPYRALFAGGSLWHLVPWWLQGAVVGGAVVLPASLIVSLAGGLKRGIQAWRPDQIIALALSVVMVVSGFTNEAAINQTGRAGSVTADNDAGWLNPVKASLVEPSTPAERQQAVAQMDREFDAVAALLGAVPSDTFDPQAILTKVGGDPSALFRWVRDSTLWVPYRGVLRGSVGVLMDRKGNDLDRSLLLAELLKMSGKEVRLAHGTLSDAQATTLIQAVRRWPVSGARTAPAMAPELRAFLDQYTKENAAEAALLRDHLNQELQGSVRMSKNTIERSGAQAQSLAAAIGLSTAPRNRAPVTADLEPAKDHWWVQWLQDTNWRDLDASLPDAEAGSRLTEVQTTVTPDKLDASLFHEVRVQVVAERWQNGRVEEVPLLTRALRPSQLYGVDVSLIHLPIAWPGSFGATSLGNLPDQVKAVGFNQHEWLPVLLVGKDLEYEFSVSDAGDKRRGRPGPIGAAGTMVERSGSAVTDLFSTGNDEAKASGFTAEWVDYEIASPGQPARTIRRQLFDLIGPAQRSAGSVPEPKVSEQTQRDRAATLLGKTEILILGSQLSRSFVSHLFAQRLLADRQPLLDFLSTAPDNVDALQRASSRIQPIPAPLYSLALARSRWSRYQDDVYIDRPVVLTAHTEDHENPQGGVTGTYSFDIVANDVAVRRDSSADPSLIRLAQGVVDTNAEAMLASDMTSESLAKNRAVAGVSEMYAQSAGQGVKWVTLRGVTDPAWQGMRVEGDARARVIHDLSDGYVVVAPDRPVTMGGRQVFGWWRVDPKDGASLGLGAHGWGVEMAEYAVMVIDTALCTHEYRPTPAQRAAAKAGHGTYTGLAMLSCLMMGGFALVSLQAAPAATLFGLSGKWWGLNVLLAQALMAAAGEFVLE